jgi:hypothetical protein
LRAATDSARLFLLTMAALNTRALLLPVYKQFELALEMKDLEASKNLLGRMA